MKRLNREEFTVTKTIRPPDGQTIMDDISAELNGTLQRNILAGLEPQIIFDNLNVIILVNIILQNHRKSGKHSLSNSFPNF